MAEQTDAPDARESPRAAMQELAKGANAADQVVAQAEAYFLERATDDAPEADTFLLDVDFGTLKRPKPARIVFKALSAPELEACERAAERRDAFNRLESIDSFVRACHVFVRAMVAPQPAALLRAAKAQGSVVEDTPGLIAHTFRSAPGIVFRVETIVRKYSRLADDDETAAREASTTANLEVQAGKTSL